MKDLELYKAQYEIEQELANLKTNNEASAFVVNGYWDDSCAQGDKPPGGDDGLPC